MVMPERVPLPLPFSPEDPASARLLPALWRHLRWLLPNSRTRRSGAASWRNTSCASLSRQTAPRVRAAFQPFSGGRDRTPRT